MVTFPSLSRFKFTSSQTATGGSCEAITDKIKGSSTKFPDASVAPMLEFISAGV